MECGPGKWYYEVSSTGAARDAYAASSCFWEDGMITWQVIGRSEIDRSEIEVLPVYEVYYQNAK